MALPVPATSLLLPLESCPPRETVADSESFAFASMTGGFTAAVGAVTSAVSSAGGAPLGASGVIGVTVCARAGLPTRAVARTTADATRADRRRERR